MSSLTADITDTNFLLDDLLHQLALHSDYSLLKQIKSAYTDIVNTSSHQQADIKRCIAELTEKVTGLEEEVTSVGLDEVRAWKEGVKGSVTEKEEEVAGLKGEEGEMRRAVEAMEDEARQVEEKRTEKMKRHTDKMQSLKSVPFQSSSPLPSPPPLSFSPLTPPLHFSLQEMPSSLFDSLCRPFRSGG